MNDFSSISDELVIESVLAGDIQAFEILVLKYRDHVARILSRHVPYQDVEDVAQEVFISAFSNIPKIKDPQAFSSWLSRIAVRACVNYWRQKSKQKEQILSELGDEHADLLERKLVGAANNSDDEDISEEEFKRLQELLQWAMGRLNPVDRMVVELVYFENRSHSEVADLIGATRGGVKIRLFRARRKLRSMIDKELRKRGHGQKV
ncbi:MAG: sigma-70 family RNA polymerase sigma factor [Thermodesulforhabdaceae bacterium]